MLPTPTYVFDFGDGVTSSVGRVKRTIFAKGQRSDDDHLYGLDDQRLARSLGRSLPPRMADLLDIGVASYIADRLAPRTMPGDSRDINDRWTRRIRLLIPVREQERWQDESLGRQLERLLGFVTDDQWEISFRRRVTEPRGSEQQMALSDLFRDLEPTVMLFSGGLDSLLGLFACAQAGCPTLAVSISSTTRLRQLQRDILSALRSSGPSRINSAQLGVCLRHASRSRTSQETSQRARGFLYAVVGAIAAVLSGRSRLDVFENGVGAINLPFTGDQFGAMNSKAVHPYTLARLTDIFSSVIGSHFEMSNPALWQTKGELCQSLLSLDRLDVVGQTVSCDRYPRQVVNKPCGCCTSCLLRRLALRFSGYSDGGKTYAFDPLSEVARWHVHDTLPVFAMRHQAERLRRVLSGSNPDHGLLYEFPTLQYVKAAMPQSNSGDISVDERLVRLYRAYLTEWDEFEAGIPYAAWRGGDIVAIDALSMIGAVAS